MGVMACDRRDCENIMCDRYAEAYGYICPGCFNEIQAARPDDTGEFMASRKPDFQPPFARDYGEIFRDQSSS